MSISAGMMVSVIAEAAICVTSQPPCNLPIKVGTYRRDGSGLDVVFGTFPSESLRETNETHLSSAVVGLAKVAYPSTIQQPSPTSRQVVLTIDSSCASGVNDPAKLLLAEDGPGGLGARESTVQMNLGDLVPFLVGHVLEPAQIEAIR